MIMYALQYLSAWNNYKYAIDHIALVPKYRMKAQEIAKSEGLLDNKKKRDKLKTKVHCCSFCIGVNRSISVLHNGN